MKALPKEDVEILCATALKEGVESEGAEDKSSALEESDRGSVSELEASQQPCSETKEFLMIDKSNTKPSRFLQMLRNRKASPKKATL